MKKAFALCALVVALILSTDSISAQENKLEVNAIASRYANTLAQKVKLNDSQKEEVYQIFQTYISKKQSIEQHEPENTEVMTTLNTYRDNQIRAIFTQEQFERYEAFMKE